MKAVLFFLFLLLLHLSFFFFFLLDHVKRERSKDTVSIVGSVCTVQWEITHDWLDQSGKKGESFYVVALFDPPL
jgi:hypothetical protein